MKMIPVEKDTARKSYGNLKALFEEFLVLGNEAVLLDGISSEYKNELVAAGCLQHAARKYGYPVKVTRKGKNIYLINLTK